MNQRLDRLFTDQNKTQFVGFVVAGDPNFATSQEILCALPDHGVDVVELGMPFSDPMADGKAIQAGYGHALAGGHTMEKTFQLVAEFRKRHPTTPLVLMGYANPIYYHGLKYFFDACKNHGVDGVIVVDMPPEESHEAETMANQMGVAWVRLLTQTSDDGRIKKLVKGASGFLYYVSVLGITGSRRIDIGEVIKRTAVIKKHTKLPIAVGFGITSPDEVAALKGKVAGVVVGSALVRTIEEGLARGINKKELVQNLLAQCKDLSAGLR